MSERLQHLSPGQAATVRQWWHALNSSRDQTARSFAENPFGSFDRGVRARLRRAVSLAEMQEEPAVYKLRSRLGVLKSPGLERDDQPWLFLVAGAVALVDQDSDALTPGARSAPGIQQSLAARLGESAAPPDGAAPMSEMRFKRLLRAAAPEDFFLQLRRALKLVPGPVDTAVLADDLLAWSAERPDTVQRAHAVRFRWARDYFLPRKDLTLAKADNESTPAHTDLTPENLA